MCVHIHIDTHCASHTRRGAYTDIYPYVNYNTRAEKNDTGTSASEIESPRVNVDYGIFGIQDPPGNMITSANAIRLTHQFA